MKQPIFEQARKGFTLIEMAIVLIVISIIIGAVFAGQDLIKASKVNAVVEEFNKYQTGINTFKVKYDAFPGDINNASTYWSGATNGDNNLRIAKRETYTMWNHMGLAGITQPYTQSLLGVAYVPTPVPGTHYPRSKHCTQCGWTAINTVINDITNWGWSATSANRMLFGWVGASASTEVNVLPAISGYGAYTVDTKMDDGMPATGKVMAGNGYSASMPGNPVTTCVNNMTSAGTYQATIDNGPACAMFFNMDIDDQ